MFFDDQNPATTAENSATFVNGRPSLYHASMQVSPGSMIILTISDIISEPQGLWETFPALAQLFSPAHYSYGWWNHVLAQ